MCIRDRPQDVHEGGTIMLDDGLIKLAIKSVSYTDIVCEVLNSGKIKTKKGVNVPGVHLSMPYLSQRDRDDIKMCIRDRVYSVRLGLPSGVTQRPMMLPPCRPMGASMTPGPRGSSPSTTA